MQNDVSKSNVKPTAHLSCTSISMCVSSYSE